MPEPTFPLHPAASERPPRVLLDRYEVGEELGRGSFATVYAGLDRRTGTEVALKRLPWRADDRLLRRELVALRHARVPGVVPLLDDLHLPDAVWLVLARIRGLPFPGGDVGAPAHPDRLRDRTAKLLRIVARLHRVGLAHQDLKPHNVLVDRHGDVHVLDLGIASARWLRASHHDGFEGTLHYAAPEQRRAELVGDEDWDRRRADLYAVGVMVFEALTGRLLHPPMSPREAWRTLVLGDEPELPDLRALRPDTPAELAAFVQRMLSTAPGDRPADAAEALVALGVAPPILPASLVAHVPDVVDDVALEALFEGPEPLLHLPSRAARALTSRAGRRRADVEAELGRWLRDEAVTVVEGRLRVSRDALAELEVEDTSGAATPRLRVQAAELELLATRGAGDRVQERAATRALTAAAVVAEERDALDRALRLVDDDVPDGIVCRDCASLLRFWDAAAVRRDRAAAAAAAFEPAEPFQGELALAYQGARVMHALAVGPDEADAVLRELAPWADGDGAREARLATWRGLVRYRQRRFSEAAAAHALSTRLRDDARGRLASRINELNCLLEAGAFDEVSARAPELVDDAVALGAQRQELQAHICAAHASYRGGGVVRVDVDLVDAAMALQPRDAVVLVLPMAASAWREGRTVDVARLTERVLRRAGLGSLAVRALLEGLRIASGFEPLTLDAPSLATAVRGLPPGVALQVLALTWPRLRDEPGLPSAFALANQLDGPTGRRLEVLSAAEALASVT